MKIVILLSLIIASNVWAACPQKVKAALGPGHREFEVTADSYRSFGAQLAHYRKTLEPSFPVKIESVTARYRSGKLTGYEVGISDQSDESFVRYVTDAKKRTQVAYWSNQSPMTFWFCGNRTTISEEDTIDGSEIH